MNKEEAFEFISRMDWMHPKMKEACKVVEHELFRPKQEPPIDIELSDSLKAKLKEYAEKVASEMYEEYKQKKIAENNNSCPNDSNNWIQSPLDEDSDLISIQGDELIFTTHEGKGRVVICKKGERFYFDKKLINNLGEHEHIRNLIFKFNENKNAGRFYHLDFPNGEPNKEAYVSGYDDLGKPIIEQKPFQINCGPIEEEKRNSGCFEKVYIYVPITNEYKVLNKSASDGKIFYRLALKKEIPKEFMILDGAVYHSGAEVTKQVSEIVMKLINDYEEGLAKEEEKKDEPEGTLFLADDLKVFGVSYDHENKCVIYSYFNRGEFEKVTRHSNGEFTYKGIKLGATTTNKLKDSILDYWTNVINK